MMYSGWTDLSAASVPRQQVEADVCIIGAGAAGIYLASRLARYGKGVVLVEAGPRACVDHAGVGFDVLFETTPYPGATVGRFFGMGGSTSRWGGALVPHTSHDARPNAAFTDEWSHIIRIVAARANDVLSEVGYETGSDFDTYPEVSLGQITRHLKDAGLSVQSGLYLPFRKKNLVSLLDRYAVRKNTRGFFNAVAKSWHIVGSNQGTAPNLRRLTAVSSKNNQLTVSADRFIIAAGALESARILLDMDTAGPRSIFKPQAAIGRYLADHLSVPVADVVPENRSEVFNLFGPRFSGDWMRSFRFLLTCQEPTTPRAFAHFNFDNQNHGFLLAKELLGAMQGRRMPRLAIRDVAYGAADLGRLAYQRLLHSRLYIPDGTPAYLQLDMEQEPVRDNGLTLTDQLDRYGRRVPLLKWEISVRDIDSIRTLADNFLCRWSNAGGGLPALQPRIIGDGRTKPYDAYHPVGTCRMGKDAEAVVNYDLRVCGLNNLWVVSTGVLPSAGTANPTFTMLCLAHHLADWLQAH